MSTEGKLLHKVESTDSVLSSDNANKSFPIKDETHKSLENVFLGGPSYVGDTCSMTSRSESLINFQVFDEEFNAEDKALEIANAEGNASEACSQQNSETPSIFEGKVENQPIDETVHVGFEEPKITKPLPTVDSARSLMKFFIESPTCGGEDLEGKHFFDSFTTTQEEEFVMKGEKHLVVSSPPKSPKISLLPNDSNMSTSDNKTELDIQPQTIMTSNLEGCCDIWIPSEKTKQSLLTVLHNGPNVIVPFPTSELTMPGVIIEESLGDPIKGSILKHIGDQEAERRLVLNVDSVPQDQVGLQQLIRADCLRAAVDLTSRLLITCGQGPGKMNQLSTHTPFSIQLWFCRLSLLTRLHLYGPAECEWQPFGDLDNPDLYYEFHQSRYPGKKGSMVPFEMRILHAEFPQCLQRHQESLDRLYLMLAVINKIIKNLKSNLFEAGSDASEKEWKESFMLWESREQRILYCIANCLLAMKDHNNSLKVLRILLDKDISHRDDIHSVLGRIYLQVGDVERAKEEFSKVSSHHFSSENDMNVQKLLNEALVELGNSEFNKATQLFKRVYEINKENILAMNNMCVCMLYLEKLKESLKHLELLIYTTPKLYLQEILVLNLCTMYELESSKANIKKQNLLRLIGQHKGTGFNVACLKLL